MATVLLSPLASNAVPAGATSLASAQAQAAQLESEISAEQSRVDSLSQAYDAAQIKVTALNAQVTAAKASLAKMTANVAGITTKLRAQAIQSWVNQGSGSSLQALLEGNASQLMVRQQFINSVGDNEQNTVDALNIAERAEHAKQESLTKAQAAANAEFNTVASDKSAAINETAAYQNTLAQVHGQIATLVAQIQAEQQAKRQAAAQAAANQLAAQQAQQAQQAQAQATAAAAPLGSSGGGGLPTVSGSSGPPPPPGGGASTAVSVALAQLGTPYVWGGASPGGFDCSGLVLYAWGQAGVSLPHYTGSQYADTTQVPLADAQPGDLVFYYVPGEANPGHVALYIGGGQVVSANETGTNVQTQSIYYDGNIMGVGRVS